MNPCLRTKILIAVGCVAILVLVFGKVASGRSETLTFTVVDAITGAPLTETRAYPVQQWTELPLEKLKMGFSSFRHFAIRSSNQVIKVSGVSQQSRLTFSIAFVAEGYRSCTFRRGTNDSLLDDDGGQGLILLPKTNEFRIRLRPKRASSRSSVDSSGRVVGWETVTNGLGIRFSR